MSSRWIITTPAVRALLAAGATAAALYAVKPVAFFDPAGRPRLAKWAVSRPDQVSEAVAVPWWLAAVGVGLAVDLFV